MSLLTRRQTLAFLGAAVCSHRATAQTAPRAFGGADFPPSMLVGGQTLVLNGAGIRYKAMFQVYAAGLYLEQLSTTTEGVLQARGSKRVAATMLRTANANELANLFTKGILDNNPSQVTTQILPSLARMSAVFSRFKTLNTGDQFMVDRLPGKGMVLSVRGEPQHEPFDEVFFDAMLNIWLGPRAADPALKQALLGSDPYLNRPALASSS